jgi:hypothetical protein
MRWLCCLVNRICVARFSKCYVRMSSKESPCRPSQLSLACLLLTGPHDCLNCRQKLHLASLEAMLAVQKRTKGSNQPYWFHFNDHRRPAVLCRHSPVCHYGRYGALSLTQARSQLIESGGMYLAGSDHVACAMWRLTVYHNLNTDVCVSSLCFVLSFVMALSVRCFTSPLECRTSVCSIMTELLFFLDCFAQRQCKCPSIESSGGLTTYFASTAASHCRSISSAKSAEPRAAASKFSTAWRLSVDC